MTFLKIFLRNTAMIGIMAAVYVFKELAMRNIYQKWYWLLLQWGLIWLLINVYGETR